MGATFHENDARQERGLRHKLEHQKSACASAFVLGRINRVSRSLFRRPLTDVAVAFSHCGQTAVVIDAVRQARRNGARIIAVTNCRTSILAQESDVILCPNVEESLITGENAAARIAQLNIVDALFLAVAQKSSGIAERNLRRTTSAVRGQRNVW